MERSKFSVWFHVWALSTSRILYGLALAFSSKSHNTWNPHLVLFMSLGKTKTYRGRQGTYEYDRLLAINQMIWVDFNHVAALNRPFDRCNASYVFSTPGENKFLIRLSFRELNLYSVTSSASLS